MFDPIVAYLFETSNVLSQEVNYIRAEMHEQQQILDRAEIDQLDAEENERQYRETMRDLAIMCPGLEEVKSWKGGVQ